MSKRPPAAPPELDGYRVARLLGSGGFADVYLYAQTMPRRNVAIKILLPGAADEQLAAQFAAEANLMAALSSHPAIVTIYQAGLASDGRPFLVMEYCSGPNLAVRYRAERLSVAEVLRIGVRIGGAVETAHRASILHRDIKPANVLTTDFGHPALSDFGISVSRTSPQARSGTVGMSIPWTAPEVFAEGTGGDERSDVYSLAATVYTVLARRSPFDRPGGPNGSADLIGRIRTSPVPPLGRADVPASLGRVLTRAMDKNPAARYGTALDFARALQRVETELRLAPTPIDVLDENPAAAGDAEAGGLVTRIRSLTVIDPAPDSIRSRQPHEETTGRIAAAMPAPADLDAAAGIPEAAQLTVQRDDDATPAGRRSRLPLLVGGGALVVVAAVVTSLLVFGGTSTPPPGLSPDQLPTSTGGADALGGSVPLPANLVADRNGATVQFHWTNPDPKSGDMFQWYRTDSSADKGADAGTAAGAGTTRHVTDRDSASVKDAGRVCVAVLLVRKNGTSSPQPATACAKAQ